MKLRLIVLLAVAVACPGSVFADETGGFWQKLKDRWNAFWSDETPAYGNLFEQPRHVWRERRTPAVDALADVREIARRVESDARFSAAEARWMIRSALEKLSRYDPTEYNSNRWEYQLRDLYHSAYDKLSRLDVKLDRELLGRGEREAREMLVGSWLSREDLRESIVKLEAFAHELEREGVRAVR